MITSQQLQDLTIAEFSFLYAQCKINQETELILGKVFEEQYINKKNILLHDIYNIPEIYHIAILESLKNKLLVSSIYIKNTTLYIDWSLPHAKIDQGLS